MAEGSDRAIPGDGPFPAEAGGTRGESGRLALEGDRPDGVGVASSHPRRLQPGRPGLGQIRSAWVDAAPSRPSSFLPFRAGRALESLK